jgi:hypothetical protein
MDWLDYDDSSADKNNGIHTLGRRLQDAARPNHRKKSGKRATRRESAMKARQLNLLLAAVLAVAITPSLSEAIDGSCNPCGPCHWHPFQSCWHSGGGPDCCGPKPACAPEPVHACKPRCGCGMLLPFRWLGWGCGCHRGHAHGYGYRHGRHHDGPLWDEPHYYPPSPHPAPTPNGRALPPPPAEESNTATRPWRPYR